MSSDVFDSKPLLLVSGKSGPVKNMSEPAIASRSALTFATAEDGKDLDAPFADVVKSPTGWSTVARLNRLCRTAQQLLARVLDQTYLALVAGCPSWIS